MIRRNSRSCSTSLSGASADALVEFERDRLKRTEAWTGWALDAQSIIEVFRLWSGAERMTAEPTQAGMTPTKKAESLGLSWIAEIGAAGNMQGEDR